MANVNLKQVASERTILALKFRALLKEQEEVAQQLADTAKDDEERLDWVTWAQSYAADSMAELDELIGRTY